MDDARLTVDGHLVHEDYVTLVDDGRDHQIHIALPSKIATELLDS